VRYWRGLEARAGKSEAENFLPTCSDSVVRRGGTTAE
jgi:hypothetical protein